jgi:putative DNA-invertase from lambdoid prophage Rac
MSRLMVTMLAAVAEFERDLIRDRTRLGLRKARAAGKRIGRPRGPAPDRAAVQRLRRQGRSWREVSMALGCTTWAARQAV